MDDLERYTRYLPGEPEKPSRRRFKGSRLAVASLVLGFLSLLGMTLPGVGVAIGLAAVVSGCVALARLEGEAGPGPAWGILIPAAIFIALLVKPRGRAILGLSLGLVGVGLNILVMCVAPSLF